MTRGLIVTSLIALALAPVAALDTRQSPSAPPVDQILDKYVTALGGRQAIEKITSRIATGTMEIADMNVSGSIQIYEKAPDKSAAVLEFSGIGQVREGYDGTVAWEENPQTGLREKTGAELGESRRSSIFNAELKFKDIYPTLVVAGREAVNGRDAWIVEGTPTDGTPVRMYFDVENGLIVRQSATRTTEQGPVVVDAYPEDYRTVDGVKQPFRIRQVTAMYTAVISIAEIRHNQPIDDAVFRKPGGPR
jgi:hypothetical protein